MKKVVLIFLVLTKFYCQGQTDDKSVIYISNKKNFEISFFSKLKLDKEKTKYSFVAELDDIGKYQDYSNLVPIVTNTQSKHYTTAFSFIIDGDKSIIYRYPIYSKKFNYKYYNKNIHPPSSINLAKVKIYTSIYKTDSIPVIVIDKIKLIK